mgnify:CR=1 FL=1
MIQISLPTFLDSAGKEILGLYEVLRKISFLAVSYNEIIKSGLEANRPLTGRRVFYYATDSKQWYAYTGDSSVGSNGWVVFG